jgi:hypothetical protein
MSKLIFKNRALFKHLSFPKHTKNTPNKLLYSTNYVDELVQTPSLVSSQQPKFSKKVNYKVSERGFYDTHAFVKTLVESGDFNQQQAESLCLLFKDITNYIADDVRSECVSKSGQVN